jgi:S-methylmethionine-dependent homocysteine/selenocysteine methylase
VTGPFRSRFDERGRLLIDGAMGTELDRRGVRTYLPLWSALGLIDHPEVVREIHGDYATAGADILITNTFRTTRRTLEKAGCPGDQAAELNALAVRVAREAAAEAGSNALIAGSIAPLEDCYRPHKSPEPAIAYREHREQAEQLAAAGADFLMVETMPLIAEAEAATRAALETGLEVSVGFVLDDVGRLISGESLAEAVERISRMPISAILINCSPPRIIGPALAELQGLTALPFGGYANLGEMEEVVGWTIDESIDGPVYAAAARQWLDSAATLIGGCCGTRPEHITPLRGLLDERAVTTG